MKLCTEEIFEEHKLAKFSLEHQGNTYSPLGLGLGNVSRKDRGEMIGCGKREWRLQNLQLGIRNIKTDWKSREMHSSGKHVGWDPFES